MLETRIRIDKGSYWLFIDFKLESVDTETKLSYKGYAIQEGITTTVEPNPTITVSQIDIELAEYVTGSYAGQLCKSTCSNSRAVAWSGTYGSPTQDMDLSSYTPNFEGNVTQDRMGYGCDIYCNITVKDTEDEDAEYHQERVFEPVNYYYLCLQNGDSPFYLEDHLENTEVDLSKYQPTKSGYSFDGWYTSATGGTEVTSVTLTEDTTYYAHWTRLNTYKIIFKGNGHTGGEIPGDITKTGDSGYVSIPRLGSAVPERTGYTFRGWSASQSYSNSRIAYSQAKGGYADRNGTSAKLIMYSQTYLQYCSYTGGNSSNTTLTLYAQWEPNQYTITFDPNGGSLQVATENKEVFYDSTYGEMPVPTRTGYSFDGWYTEAAGGTKITSATKVNITSAQTLYAHWKNYTYKVICHGSGGIYDGKDTYVYEENSTEGSFTFTLDKVFERKAYVLDHWHNSDYSVDVDVGDSITLNSVDADEYGQVVLDLYAEWNKPHINLHGNGGTFGDFGPNELMDAAWDGDEPYVSEAHTPNRGSDKFKYWTTDADDADGSGDKYDPGAKIDVNDITKLSADQKYYYIDLYAQWTPATKYTVTFKNWNGTVISSEKYILGEAVVLPQMNPTKPADMTYNYTFAGWDPAVEAVCTGDKTYTATYTENYIDYTVTFLDHDSRIVKSSNYHYGARVVIPAAQTRQITATHSYTFKGWDKNNSNTIVEAQNETYHFKFNGNEGDIGYWAKGCIGDGFSKAIMQDGTLQLIGNTGIRHWATIQTKYGGLANLSGKVFGMSVTFQLPDGGITSSGILRLLMPLTGAQSGSGGYAGGIILTNNILYAGSTVNPMTQYELLEPNTKYIAEIIYDYRITGQAQGSYYVYKENGDIVADATVLLASLHSYYETDSFHSIGFRAQDTGENAVKVDDFKTYIGDTFSTCSGNDIFLASYEATTRKYTLGFDTWSDDCFIAPREVENGAEIGYLPTPTRKYYRFLGWYTEPKDVGGKPVTESTIMPAGDFYIHAHWEILATTFIKVNEKFKTGIPFIKIGTEWKRAVGVYIKTANGWKRSTK